MWFVTNNFNVIDGDVKDTGTGWDLQFELGQRLGFAGEDLLDGSDLVTVDMAITKGVDVITRHHVEFVCY